MQKPYIPVRGRKLSGFMGGSKRPRLEIGETSGLPIPMVPRFHQSNGFLKKKVRVWRAQNCNALVGAETVLTCAAPQTTPFHGGQYRAENGNIRNFGPTIRMVPRLHQSNGYIKRYLLGCRAQKYNALVSVEIILRGRQLPRFMGSNKGPRMEMCESSSLPNPMVPRLHQSNAYIERYLRVWRAQKCNATVGSKTVPYQCGAANYPVLWGAVYIRPRMEICEPPGLPIPMVPRLHQRNG